MGRAHGGAPLELSPLWAGRQQRPTAITFTAAEEERNPDTIDHHWPLSIDENRQIFAPEIWDESEESPEAKARGRIKQVSFPGVHSDIGGGYPETGLSDLALEWMIKEAMGARVDQRRCTRTKDPCSSKNASSKNREVA